ncbi:MAG TPA: methyltransferase domain-containing protein [Terracidiphilus sp.]|jgi:2-polyprenyl-3-methyl-5-hydroxy-6-metoxy-1,4-benzoquinol methylase|nr:methyltransferase domain-containing protein [Terracidiphilus sp.]
MPHNPPDFRCRAQLTELMDEPCGRDVLRGCLRDIGKVNRWFLGYRPLFAWLNSMRSAMRGTIRILDAGCGDGDCVRRIARWARSRGIAVELIGLDINPDAIAIAAEAEAPRSNIEWVAANIFDYTPSKPVDLVVSCLFAHHLTDEEIVRFLAWMEDHSALGWFINDLTRAAVPYHLFRVFTKFAGLHPFVQHDGPVSIARAFRPQDWERYCGAAGLRNGQASICGYTPARLCVARSKAR